MISKNFLNLDELTDLEEMVKKDNVSQNKLLTKKRDRSRHYVLKANPHMSDLHYKIENLKDKIETKSSHLSSVFGMVLEELYRNQSKDKIRSCYNRRNIKDFDSYSAYFHSAVEPELRERLIKGGFNLKSTVEGLFRNHRKIKRLDLKKFDSIDKMFGFLFQDINNLPSLPDHFGELDFQGSFQLVKDNLVMIKVGEYKSFLGKNSKTKAKLQCMRFLNIAKLILNAFDNSFEIELKAEIHYSFKEKGISTETHKEHGITYVFLNLNDNILGYI